MGRAERAQRRARFGAELAAAMEARRVSQTALAGVLGRAQNTVSTWVSGDAAPSPEVVFDVEGHLGLAPGTLSRHLGYVPAPTPAGGAAAPVGDGAVVEAVEADPRLTDDQRNELIGMFRAFIAAVPQEPGH